MSARLSGRKFRRADFIIEAQDGIRGVCRKTSMRDLYNKR
jgi:hypothetical protein